MWHFVNKIGYILQIDIDNGTQSWFAISSSPQPTPNEIEPTTSPPTAIPQRHNGHNSPGQPAESEKNQEYSWKKLAKG